MYSVTSLRYRYYSEISGGTIWNSSVITEDTWYDIDFSKLNDGYNYFVGWGQGGSNVSVEIQLQ